MGIPIIGGQCLAVNLSAVAVLNTKLFAWYLGTHPGKNTWKVFQMSPRAIKRQLTRPFKLTSGSSLIGRMIILVIPRNHLVSKKLQIGHDSDPDI